ncbi:MAG: flagellar basal body-associated FliL family protein [Oligoflexia bacterium]|nr:flagellar basal body-associated FliL family protein [Oligoflexia bacterium]
MITITKNVVDIARDNRGQVFISVLGGLNLLLGLLTIGLFFYTGFIYRPAKIDDKTEFNNFKQRSNVETNSISIYKLERFTLNLYSSQTTPHYLDIEMHFHLLSESEAGSLIDKNKPIIYDRIISIINATTLDEVNSVTGKIILEERIKTAVATAVGRPVVKSVYFAIFTVR